MDLYVPHQYVRPTRARARDRLSLVWAYGSNLCHDQMARRCPDALPLEPLVLYDLRLVFRGVADVARQPGRIAAGGLYALTPTCERKLDVCEGVSTRAYRKQFFTLYLDGEPEDVLFYRMVSRVGIMPPPEDYFDTIARGYRDFGLDRRLLDRALNEAWACKDVTPPLRERHRRRGKPRLARSAA